MNNDDYWEDVYLDDKNATNEDRMFVIEVHEPRVSHGFCETEQEWEVAQSYCEKDFKSLHRDLLHRCVHCGERAIINPYREEKCDNCGKISIENE